ncbi:MULTISPECIES: hypothetical protein [unclassified Salinibacterium]|uniref:hypothetical protein n=1 Tax=unclassified Salinibacterium TaxID=2632331 RepID=UPI001421675E|nr:MULTISPECIES: hypothetical protein [unclassified Salinibacterium]
MTIATRLPMVLLGVVIVLLIPAPFTSMSSELNDLYEDFLGPVIVVVTLACILIGSVMGAAVMMGWRAGIIGVVFSGSITAAGVGALTDEPIWTNIGIAGFAVSCAGYYFIGELSGYLPVKTREAYGGVAMIPGGIIMGVVGIAMGNQTLVLFGFGAAGAALGVTLARLWRRRRARAAVADA